jgi:hypothetical protein
MTHTPRKVHDVGAAYGTSLALSGGQIFTGNGSVGIIP